MPTTLISVLSGAAVTILYVLSAFGIGSLISRYLFRTNLSRPFDSLDSELTVVWLVFIIGQGVLATGWLFLALVGVLTAPLVWIGTTAGVLFGLLHIRQAGSLRTLFVADDDSFYKWTLRGLIVLVLLRGSFALLPPYIDDAIMWYLPVAKIIAYTHSLRLEPLLAPHSALYPMQIDLHWAALFTITNEAAVTLWDYTCGVSSLIGIAILGALISGDRRVGLICSIILFSTPGFFKLMGSGKTDVAALQFGLAIFVCLFLWAQMRNHSLAWLAGLFGGWAFASRYSNFILIPAVVVFSVTIAVYTRRTTKSGDSMPSAGGFLLQGGIRAGIAACLTAVPMLVKNLVIAECPLAPFVGCSETYWASAGAAVLHTNISVLDSLFYPFVWTFFERDAMLGGISPLFLAFFPTVLIAYRGAPTLTPALLTGIAGATSIAIFMVMFPLSMYTRWVFAPLALVAVAIAAFFVYVDRTSNRPRARMMLRACLILALLFTLFENRRAVYAVRYLVGAESRTQWYERLEGSTYAGLHEAEWLNANVGPGERVAMGQFNAYRYYLKPDLFLRAETDDEVQMLWKQGWLWIEGSAFPVAEYLNFCKQQDFAYAVLPLARVERNEPLLARKPSGFCIVFRGAKYAVLKQGCGD